MKRCLTATALGIDNKIKVAGRFGRESSEDLPEPPFYAIANDCPADLARNGQAHTVMTQIVLPAKKHKPSGLNLEAAIV